MTETSRSRIGPTARWAALLFAAVQLGLLASTARDKSDTIDEPHYLATAVRQWREGDVGVNPDSPALPKWGYAFALRLADPELFDEGSTAGRHPLWSRPPAKTQSNLIAARSVTILLTVAAGLALFAAARRFGVVAALVAQALWCLSPAVLANGSLATLDGWVAAWLCFAVLAGVRLVEAPRLRRAALLGVALGLAAACKVTALGALPVAAALCLWLARDTARGSRRLQLLGAAAVGFFLALWASYGFEWGTLDLSLAQPASAQASPRPVGPLPFPSWFLGLLLQARHGQGGHLSYLFGHVSASGWWWFYLAVLAFKTTVGAQGLALGSAVAACVRGGGRRVDAVLLAFPLLLFFVMSLGRAQIGVRYLLPAYPFFLFWLGIGAARVAAQGSLGRFAVALVVCLGVAESLAVHPHHLMFFNAWAGGPDGGPRYLVTGDDWGQDQRRLGAWQAEKRPPTLYYTYYNGDPAHWGITYRAPPCSPAPGHYALHAVEVHRPKRIAPGCLDWLTVEPPDARLGHSIYLYQVTRARIERLERERSSVAPFFRSGGMRRDEEEDETR